MPRISIPRSLLTQAALAVVGVALAVPAAAASPPVPAGSPADRLPLIVQPSHHPAHALAVFISGDGGWAPLDAQLSQQLERGGYDVVGLDAARYFWDRKTPQQLTSDLAAIAKYYLEAWHCERLLLVGYSRGAEVLPFGVTRLGEALTRKLQAVVLLAPSLFTGFKFHFADLWSNHRHPDSVDTLPAAKRVTERVICFYGAAEQDSLCPALNGGSDRTVVKLPGGHHFDHQYRAIGRRLLALLGVDGPDKQKGL